MMDIVVYFDDDHGRRNRGDTVQIHLWPDRNKAQGVNVDHCGVITSDREVTP